jgi:cholesterol transport system auxiliary component
MMRAVLSVILGAMLAACAGSLFKNKIPPPTMYMLSARKAPAAEAPSSLSSADLAVLRPRVRAGLDTDRIAALYPDRRIDYFANVRWSGPLDEVLQDFAVQEIHSSVGLHNVSADRSVFASAYWLEIEVTDFQAEYSASAGAPTVHVHMQARLGTSSDRKVLARFEPNVYEAASDNRMSAIVEAYSRAADKALSEIGQGAAQALAK